ncbi:MAG: protealysin inhibitor emfourin [Pseudolysinimonas sp.]
MAQQPDERVAIEVVRSGGFAGISRRWRVEPARDDAEWTALIDACPWGYSGSDTTSRDRYVWRIEVRVRRRTRRASVPDRDLDGPWQQLVDRVQAVADQDADG